MNIIKTFGKRLKKLRNERNISQEKLAELASLHRTYISSLECGRRNPTITTLYVISKALNITISLLVSGVEDE